VRNELQAVLSIHHLLLEVHVHKTRPHGSDVVLPHKILSRLRTALNTQREELNLVFQQAFRELVKILRLSVT